MNLTPVALEYASRGLPVFPVFGWIDGRCSCGKDCGKNAGKHPTLPQGHNQASTDPEQIRRWFDDPRLTPDALNIGIVVPDGYAVVDVDPRDNGLETLAKLEAQYGDLPKTATVLTGSGGAHIWYRVPPGLTFPAELGEGIQIKASGRGYVVAPPSLHASGQRYQWQTSGGTIPTPVEAPPWLAARGRTPQLTAAADVTGDEPVLNAIAIEALAELIAPACQAGRRHNLIKALGGWMHQRGLGRADLAGVVRELGKRGVLQHPEARLKAGLAAWEIPVSYGYQDLVAMGVNGELLECVPNPVWQAEQQRRKKAASELESLATQTIALVSAVPPTDQDFWCGFTPEEDDNGEPLDCLIAGLDIVPGYTTALIGRASNAKTPVALSMALALANAKPWLGRTSRKCNVIYYAHEKPLACRRKRRRIARTMGVDPKSVHLVSGKDARLSDGQGAIRAAQLAANMMTLGLPVVVIVDTYGSAVVGLDHNDAEYSEPLKLFSSVLTGIGVAVVVLMHCRKTDQQPTLESIEGHTSIAGALDAAISLHRPTDDAFTFEVNPTRTIEDGFQPFCLRWDNVAFGEGLMAEPRWGLACTLVQAEQEEKPLTAEQGTAIAKNKIKSFMLARLQGATALDSVSQREILESMPGVKRLQVIAALKEMRADGELIRERKGEMECYALPVQGTGYGL